MKIFIVSPNIDVLFSDPQKAKLESLGDVVYISDIKPLEEIQVLYEGDEDRILAIDPDFCDWKVSNDVVDKMPNLKAVCLQTTSFSWVDIDHLKSKGVPVMNLVGFSAVAVADWATMVILALARRLPIVIKDSWKLDYDAHRGVELRGKKAGIVGLGNIGTAFAENMAGLGMDVQYWSKNSRDERYNYAELEELMSSSDVILLATANNDETKTLLTDDMLNNMRSSSMFMTITDALYNQELMLSLVKNGKIYGYGFEDEKNSFGFYDGNVWNGPALGWCTEESMSKNATQWLDSIVSASNGDYPTQINA